MKPENFITIANIARAANSPMIRAERRLTGLSPDGVVHSGMLKTRVFLADRLPELVRVVNASASLKTELPKQLPESEVSISSETWLERLPEEGYRWLKAGELVSSETDEVDRRNFRKDPPNWQPWDEGYGYVVSQEEARGFGFRRRLVSKFVPGEGVQDKRLSFRARGVLAYALSLPDQYHCAKNLAAASPAEGVESIRTALRELQQFGYAEYNIQQAVNGRWQHPWRFHQSPCTGGKEGV
jgi:hypothetical protein